jgi:hypothetical protein
VYNNLLFGLFVRIVVYVSFFLFALIHVQVLNYLKHILEQQIDGKQLDGEPLQNKDKRAG